MAQSKDSLNQGLISEKAKLDSFFADVNRVLPKLSEELVSARKSGNKELEGQIAQKMITLQSEADLQNNRYAEIQEKLEAPKLREISKATEALRTGSYKEQEKLSSIGIPGGGIMMFPSVAFKTKEQEERENSAKKQLLSIQTNIPSDAINLDSKNMPASQRFVLGALQSADSEAQYLEGKYGQGNIYPVQIDGETRFVVKKKDGTAFTTEKKGAAGTAGAAIVEVPIMASEIGAGIGTLAVTRSPSLAIVASGAARTGVGTLTDSMFEQFAGVEPQWYRAFTRRGGEALFSVATGFAVDRATSKYIGNRISSQFPNEFAQNLEKSASRIMAREKAAASTAGRKAGEISIPSGAKIGGPRGLETQQVLAGELPDSGFVGSMKRTQETLRGLWDSYTNNVPIDPAKFANVAKSQRANMEKLTREIANRSNLSADAVKASVEKRMAAYNSIGSNTDKLGEDLGKYVIEADTILNEAKKAEINQFADLANQAGFEMDAKNLLDLFSSARRELNPKGAVNDVAVKSIEDRLRRRAFAEELLQEAQVKRSEIVNSGRKVPFELEEEIKELSAKRGPVDSVEFDSWVKEYNNLYQDNLVGSGTKDALGSMVSQNVAKKRREIYSNYNVDLPDGTKINLGDQFQKVADSIESRNELQRGLLGRVVAEESGTNKMFPREIVSTVMKEPAKIRKVLDAVKNLEASDPTKAGITADITDKMQKQYLDSLGFGRPGIDIRSIKYDRQMMEELWGNSAPRIMQDMDEIMSTIKKADYNNQLTFDDVKRMGSVLDLESRRQVKKEIVNRLKSERQLEILQNKEIFKLAKKGDFKSIDPDQLSAVVLSNAFTANETKDLMLSLSKHSTDARNLYKGDFARELLNKFPGGDSPAGPPYTPMFDTEGFVKAMDAPIGKSQFRKKVETVLGEDDANFLYDLATVYNANKIKAIPAGDPVRFTAGLGGVSFYLAHGVNRGIRNRLMAAMLTSGSQRHGLKRALAKEIGGGAVDEQYRQMFKEIFTTRNGLMALSNQGKDDEEFSNYLSEMAKKFREDDAELNSIVPE